MITKTLDFGTAGGTEPFVIMKILAGTGWVGGGSSHSGIIRAVRIEHTRVLPGLR